MSRAAISRIWFSNKYWFRMLPGPASKTKMPLRSCSTAQFPCPTSRMASLGEAVIRIRLGSKFEIAEEKIFIPLCAGIHHGLRIPSRNQSIDYFDLRVGVATLNLNGSSPRPSFQGNLAIPNLPGGGHKALLNHLRIIVEILCGQQNRDLLSMQAY